MPRPSKSPPSLVRIAVVVAMLAFAFSLAACSKMPELVVGTLPVADSTPAAKSLVTYSGTPIELYTLIAKGANACWFGRDGPLKETHIFHAEVEPSHKGGNSEITIYERDKTSPTGNPRSLRALRVIITQADAKTQVDVQPAAKLPEPQARQMTADVHRWAGGDPSCARTPVPAAGAPSADAASLKAAAKTGGPPPSAPVKGR